MSFLNNILMIKMEETFEELKYYFNAKMSEQCPNKEKTWQKFLRMF